MSVSLSAIRLSLARQSSIPPLLLERARQGVRELSRFARRGPRLGVWPACCVADRDFAAAQVGGRDADHHLRCIIRVACRGVATTFVELCAANDAADSRGGLSRSTYLFCHAQ